MVEMMTVFLKLKYIPFFVKIFLLFYCLINKFNKVQVTNSLKGKKRFTLLTYFHLLYLPFSKLQKDIIIYLRN